MARVDLGEAEVAVNGERAAVLPYPAHSDGAGAEGLNQRYGLASWKDAANSFPTVAVYLN